MNLVETFEETAAPQGDRIAVVEGSGRRISFADLARRSAALAEGWRARGIGAGDRVLLAMPVGIDLYAAIAGLWRLGTVVVFPEPALGLAGLRNAIEATRPRGFLSSGLYKVLPGLVPALWRVPLWLSVREGEGAGELLDVSDGHPGLISFTTGSTGKPKGIERSHGFLAAQNAAVAPMLRSKRDEVDLVAFPVFVIANLALGITSVLPSWGSKPDRATAEALRSLIAREGVTRALLPPSICEVLVEAKPEGLDAVFTGGGPVFPDLLKRMEAALPKTSVTCVYGSTEAEPIAHLERSEIGEADWERMAAGGGLLAGRPVDATAVRLIDGEIVVTGEHVNKTYLDPSRDAENKLTIDGRIWHRTGDAGTLDDDGRLWLRGRHGSEAGGLFPFEVETAARSWPGVRRSALVAGSEPPMLAIEGDGDVAEWRRRAAALGPVEVRSVAAIPLDRRHHSKVDQARLSKLIRR